MQRFMLHSKIHRARITRADLNYEGSITIDGELMEAADLLPYEMVQVYNLSNGERFETYAIKGKRGSGEICLNGAAAHKGSVGDFIIIAHYTLMTEEAAKTHQPKIIQVDGNNKEIK